MFGNGTFGERVLFNLCIVANKIISSSSSFSLSPWSWSSLLFRLLCRMVVCVSVCVGGWGGELVVVVVVININIVYIYMKLVKNPRHAVAIIIQWQ